jgi:hypothetical protein
MYKKRTTRSEWRRREANIHVLTGCSGAVRGAIDGGEGRTFSLLTLVCTGIQPRGGPAAFVSSFTLMPDTKAARERSVSAEFDVSRLTNHSSRAQTSSLQDSDIEFDVDDHSSLPSKPGRKKNPKYRPLSPLPPPCASHLFRQLSGRPPRPEPHSPTRVSSQEATKGLLFSPTITPTIPDPAVDS